MTTIKRQPGPGVDRPVDGAAPTQAPAEDAVPLEVPADPIRALQMRAELAARGLIDSNRDGFIEGAEVLPGRESVSLVSLRSAAGPDGVVSSSDVGRLPASKRRGRLRKRAQRAVVDTSKALTEFISAWPPTTDHQLDAALRGLDAASAKIGGLDPTELGLAPKNSLHLLRSLLQELHTALRDPISAPERLTLPTRRRLAGAQEGLQALRRVGEQLGLQPREVAHLRPPRVRGRQIPMSAVRAARARQAEGDVLGAWRALGETGDRYAASAADILESPDTPTNLFAQIVSAHWDRVVGPEVKAAKFEAVARNQLDNYLRALEGFATPEFAELPNTQLIEGCYRRAVEKEGLPARLAIDSVISKIDLALDDAPAAKRMGIKDLSWGSMLGLEADRLSFSCNAFADVDMKPVQEFAATTARLLSNHHVDVNFRQALDMSMKTISALWTGQARAGSATDAPPAAQALTVAKSKVRRARLLLADKRPADAWATLHEAGDGYAHYPYTVMSELEQPRSLLAQVVNAHWDRVVGPETTEEKFETVNVDFLRNYLDIIDQNQGRLPNTKEIEQAYRAAAEGEGLPAAVVPDAVMSCLGDAQTERALSWGEMVGLAKERVVYRTGVFADLDVDPMRELFADNTHWIMQRHVHMPFGQMAKMSWQRVRDYFAS